MNKKSYVRLLLSALFVLSVSSVYAESPEEKGLRLTVEENTFNKGWQDFEADLTLTLRNKQGEENVFTMRMLTKEVESDGD